MINIVLCYRGKGFDVPQLYDVLYVIIFYVILFCSHEGLFQCYDGVLIVALGVENEGGYDPTIKSFLSDCEVKEENIWFYDDFHMIRGFNFKGQDTMTRVCCKISQKE